MTKSLGFGNAIKLRNHVDVDGDFGAIGDGTTDDTAAIQAAWDSGAREIHYGKKTYKVTALTHPNYVIRHVGASMNVTQNTTSTVISGSGAVVVTCAGANSRWTEFENMNIKAAAGNIALLISNGGVGLENVHCYGGAYGIKVTSMYVMHWRGNVTAYGTTRGVLFAATDGINANKIDNLNCACENTTGYAMEISASGGGTCIGNSVGALTLQSANRGLSIASGAATRNTFDCVWTESLGGSTPYAVFEGGAVYSIYLNLNNRDDPGTVPLSINSNSTILRSGTLTTPAIDAETGDFTKTSGSNYLVIGTAAADTSDRGFQFNNQAGTAAGYIALTPNTTNTDTLMSFYVGGGSGGNILLALQQGVGATFRAVPTPQANNTYDIGTSSLRWKEIFATNGTINTSDATQKTEVQPFTADEIAASIALGKEIGTFQFLEAVAAKGDKARLHIGMTVQRAIEIMQAHGLDPFGYGFICYDEWDERTQVYPDQVDEDGNVVIEGWTDHIPAGNTYGFRAHELLFFLARGFEARLSALEGK